MKLISLLNHSPCVEFRSQISIFILLLLACAGHCLLLLLINSLLFYLCLCAAIVLVMILNVMHICTRMRVGRGKLGETPPLRSARLIQPADQPTARSLLQPLARALAACHPSALTHHTHTQHVSSISSHDERRQETGARISATGVGRLSRLAAARRCSRSRASQELGRAIGRHARRSCNIVCIQEAEQG